MPTAATKTTSLVSKDELLELADWERKYADAKKKASAAEKELSFRRIALATDDVLLHRGSLGSCLAFEFLQFLPAVLPLFPVSVWNLACFAALTGKGLGLFVQKMLLGLTLIARSASATV